MRQLGPRDMVEPFRSIYRAGGVAVAREEGAVAQVAAHQLPGLRAIHSGPEPIFLLQCPWTRASAPTSLSFKRKSNLWGWVPPILPLQRRPRWRAADHVQGDQWQLCRKTACRGADR